MRNVVIAFALIAITACRKPLEFPFVQKYQASAGDLFYFKPDGRFVLLERRKALDIAVSPAGPEAYSYPERITISRLAEHRPGEFWGSRDPGEIMENKPFTDTPTPMQVLAFSPIGGKLAGGTADGSLWIWDLTTGQPSVNLQDAPEIRALAFAPDGKTLAVGTRTHAALWDYARGQRIESFGAAAVNALAYATDGRLAAGLADGSLLIRPSPGGTPMAIQGSTAAVTSVAWHPAGHAIASAHTDKIIRLWNVETGQLIGTLASDIPLNPLFPRAIERIAFDPAGTQLAAAYADGEMRIWRTTALNPKK
jgi:WD40 repeat protein